MVEYGKRYMCDSLGLLGLLGDGVVGMCIYDPQYPKKPGSSWGDGSRFRGRFGLPQVSEGDICAVIAELGRVLRPGGHICLWVEKYYVLRRGGIDGWYDSGVMEVVDMCVWNKMRMGVGNRFRRYGEYMYVLQKLPLRAKGVWVDRGIPDIWSERLLGRCVHPHVKPVHLLSRVVSCLTVGGDLVCDPAAGSFVVADICVELGRRFVGCDLVYGTDPLPELAG